MRGAVAPLPSSMGCEPHSAGLRHPASYYFSGGVCEKLIPPIHPKWSKISSVESSDSWDSEFLRGTLSRPRRELITHLDWEAVTGWTSTVKQRDWMAPGLLYPSPSNYLILHQTTFSFGQLCFAKALALLNPSHSCAWGVRPKQWSLMGRNAGTQEQSTQKRILFYLYNSLFSLRILAKIHSVLIWKLNIIINQPG